MIDYERELRSRVTVNENGCWVWNGPYGRRGYGRYKVLGTEAAHRASYMIFKGTIPEDQPFVCHTCDNPPCVNPEHLFVGTHQDNVDDMLHKGRARGAKEGSDHHAHRPDVIEKIKKKLRKIPPEEHARVRELRKQISRADIATMYGVSITTIDRILYAVNVKDEPDMIET